MSGLDRAAKRLSAADGQSIDYDKLILCTGGRARTLTIPGAELAGVFTRRTALG